MRLRTRWSAGCVALLLCATGGAASATSTSFDLGSVEPGDVFVSGNGLLEFSDFQFHTAGCQVDPSDLTLTILDDGVEIGGPVSVTGRGHASFFISYQVTASGPLIQDASLSLDASVEGHLFPVVFATKRVIGDRPEPPGGHDWDDHEGNDHGRGHDGRGDHEGNDHGWGHHGWGLLPGASSPWSHHGNDQTLAFLRTAVWDSPEDCPSHWEWICNGDILLDEASFEAQDRIEVIDGVRIMSWKRGDEAIFFASTNRFSVVPEPGSAALLAMGLAGLTAAGRRRR